MQFKSGKYEGKEYAQVLLRDPGYASFLIDKQADGPVGKELKRLISVFDGKPFTRTCHHCTRTATRATGYIGGSSLYFWCDSCDPYGEGANPGKLRLIRTYREVVAYAVTREEQKGLLKTFAEAKGAPHPLTPSKARAFLP